MDKLKTLITCKVPEIFVFKHLLSFTICYNLRALTPLNLKRKEPGENNQKVRRWKNS